MKPEISEAILPNITQEKNYDLEVINIPYFYKLFLKEKKRYTPSLFCIGTTIRKKRPRFPTLQEFKKVVYEYLKIYFFELYMNKIPMYFCLGGFMKIVTYLPWVTKQSRSNLKVKVQCGSQGAFGLFWYYRPTTKMFHMVKIKKQAGSGNMITKIEQIFRDNHNKDLLPIFTDERKKGKKNKTLYRCIPT